MSHSIRSKRSVSKCILISFLLAQGAYASGESDGNKDGGGVDGKASGIIHKVSNVIEATEIGSTADYLVRDESSGRNLVISGKDLIELVKKSRSE